VTAVALGWLITRRLLASLGAEPVDLSEVAQRVARGDLSPVQGADAAPVGSVLASMGAMQAQLVGLIGQVRTSADSIATASAEIAQGNSDLSSRTEEQASALEETAASMEQLSSTVRQNADNARQANELAQGASTVAVRGGAVVGQVVETMKGISASFARDAGVKALLASYSAEHVEMGCYLALASGARNLGMAVIATTC